MDLSKSLFRNTWPHFRFATRMTGMRAVQPWQSQWSTKVTGPI